MKLEEDNWTVMSIEANSEKAGKLLREYRKLMPHREFRMEQHIMRVLGV
jgi:hypothetical protein